MDLLAKCAPKIPFDRAATIPQSQQKMETALGQSSGDITMTDVAKLEADPTQYVQMNEQGTAASDLVIEPGVVEFYGRTVLCLVRKLSETGAVVDMVKPCVVPDRFTLALPLEGISYRCRLAWRTEAEMEVIFQ
jgi:hypothetical protein